MAKVDVSRRDLLSAGAAFGTIAVQPAGARTIPWQREETSALSNASDRAVFFTVGERTGGSAQTSKMSDSDLRVTAVCLKARAESRRQPRPINQSTVPAGPFTPTVVRDAIVRTGSARHTCFRRSRKTLTCNQPTQRRSYASYWRERRPQ